MKMFALLGAMLLTLPMNVGVLGQTSDSLIQHVTGKRKKNR